MVIFGALVTVEVTVLATVLMTEVTVYVIVLVRLSSQEATPRLVRTSIINATMRVRSFIMMVNLVRLVLRLCVIVFVIRYPEDLR